MQHRKVLVLPSCGVTPRGLFHYVSCFDSLKRSLRQKVLFHIAMAWLSRIAPQLSRWRWRTPLEQEHRVLAMASANRVLAAAMLEASQTLLHGQSKALIKCLHWNPTPKGTVLAHSLPPSLPPSLSALSLSLSICLSISPCTSLCDIHFRDQTS